MCHLHPDLMMSSRIKYNLCKCQIPAPDRDPKRKPCLFCFLSPFFSHRRSICPRILHEIVGKRIPFRRVLHPLPSFLRHTAYCLIRFLHRTVRDLFRKSCCCLLRLCKDKHTFHRLIKPVYHTDRLKSCAACRFFLLHTVSGCFTHVRLLRQMVIQNAHKILFSESCALHCDPGRLTADKDLFIFI